MFKVDGKELDMTKPETWGDAITIEPNGYVETLADGVVTIVTQKDEPNELPQI